MGTLDLYKGLNNGLEQSVIYQKDASGNKTAFDLTGATITVEIYGTDGVVVASFAGVGVVPLTNGIFNARPGASDLTALTINQPYFYRVKIVNITFPQGRVFGLDDSGRRLQCQVH